MTRNSLFMIMLFCLMFLAGWILGSRSWVSAQSTGPRIGYAAGGGWSVQYADQNKEHEYDTEGRCRVVFTVPAPGAPATVEKCK
jgi:hypothetical protein